MNIFCRMVSGAINIEPHPDPPQKGGRMSGYHPDGMDGWLIEMDFFFHFPDVCFVDGVDTVRTVEKSGD